MPADDETNLADLHPTVFPLQFSRGGGEGLQAFDADVVGVTLHVTRIQVLDTHKGWFDGEVADVYPMYLLLVGPSAAPVQWGPWTMYNDVRPGDTLPIAANAPPTILRSLTSLPAYIDLHVVIMRSREKSRDFGAAVKAALASDAGKALVQAAQAAVSTANPAAGVAVGVGKELLELVASYLSKRKDRQLFYAAASFEHTEDLGVGLTHTLQDRSCVVELTVKPVRAKPG